MRRFLLSVFIVFLSNSSLLAQDILYRGKEAAQTVLPQINDDDSLRVRHVTDYLNRLPESRQALIDFHERKRLGLLPSRKQTRIYRINDTKTFKVINFVTETLEEIEFTLKAQEDQFWIWVETEELTNGHVRDEDVESFRVALAEQTPAGSINPDAGIIVNDETVFGNPPDVDGDGITEVLLLDIRDGWLPGNTYIAGFANPADLTEVGNHGDIIYADTNPGLYRNGTHIYPAAVEATIAHEYQHLIRYNYDPDELTFIDEGMSEWAELINGYPSRVMSFLSQIGEHQTPLFHWKDEEENYNIIYDYQRAGLFTAYLAQRIGVVATGRIVRAQKTELGRMVPVSGVEGYEIVLNQYDLSVADLVADFHTTNYLNNRSIDLDLGYEHPDFQYLKTPASRTYDGETRRSVDIVDFTLNGGSVQYHTFTNVRNFEITADIHEAIAPALIPGMRTRVRMRALLEHSDGRMERIDFGLGAEGRAFLGDFERLTIMIIHIAPQKAGVRLDIFAGWDEIESSGITLTPRVYDDGLALLYPVAPGAESGFATRFTVLENGKLYDISLPIYYDNQFAEGQPDDSPRDFNLTIWDVDLDGAPGNVLFTMLVEDSRESEDVLLGETQNRYFDINVLQELDGIYLPAQIYIGAINAGVDENYLVFSASSYPDEDLSYYRDAEGTWMPSWERVFLTGEKLLENHIIPIRATFSISAPVAVDRPDETPTQIVLTQNYPNPFNPTTTIRYHLDQASNVRLAVYDVMGRLVTFLVDDNQIAGTHEARFDASDLAGGMYIYTLEAGGLQYTKKMLLIK